MNINYILDKCETHPDIYMREVREYIQKLRDEIALLNEKNIYLESNVNSLEKKLIDVLEAVDLSSRVLTKMVQNYDL